jgi:pyruvate/2-oxoglutarate dehydrogenase complex dihydrolipoamide acyltransferase (E2) component
MVWLYDLGSSVLGFVAANPVVTSVTVLAVGAVVAILARRLGFVRWARRRPRATLALLVPMLAIALPLGWYLASPLVLSASIDEPPPAFAAASQAASVAPRPVEPTATAAAAASAAPATPAAPTAAPAETPAPIARSGSFHGSDDFHFGRGSARLLEVAPGSFVVRLEDFAVRNGPDLYVYLSPKSDGYATDAIELGRLKADTGNQNYIVPAALDDPAEAASVVIWCKQFSHLFATAPLAD